MAKIILHHQGAYQLYETIADGPVYVSALTFEQLKKAVMVHGGQAALANLPDSLERAHRTGCSSMDGATLKECISTNRAGHNETTLPEAEFIARWLTLPPHDSEGSQ